MKSFLNTIILTVFALAGTLQGADSAHRFDPTSEDSLAYLRAQRDLLRAVDRQVRATFLGFESLTHAVYVSRLIRGNMLLMGPPGGAKSAFVQYFLEQEAKSYFKILMHSMLSEHPFVGSQGLDSLKSGEFSINTKGTIGEFTLANIEELGQGNAAALASLLNILNERIVAVGGRQVPADVNTIFASTNVNLAEFYAIFFRKAEEQTALALINRIQFKGYTTEFLGDGLQVELDRSSYDWFVGPEGQRPAEGLVYPAPIDWTFLRSAAQHLFKRDETMIRMSRLFMRNIRSAYRSHMKIKNKNNRVNYIMTPGVISERVRRQIHKVIAASAFVDFLLSPLANDGQLEQHYATKIAVDYTTLWRTHLVLTTLMPGATQLKWTQAGDALVPEVQFPSFEMDAINERDEMMFQNFKFEQDKFKEQFSALVSESKAALAALGPRQPTTPENATRGASAEPVKPEKAFEQLLFESHGR